jgi:hypothetical protein
LTDIDIRWIGNSDIQLKNGRLSPPNTMTRTQFFTGHILPNIKSIWRVLSQEDLGYPSQIRNLVKWLDPRPVNSAVKRGNESTHIFSLNDAGNQDLEEPARLLLRILSLSNDNLGSEIKVAASVAKGDLARQYGVWPLP